jgi:hypothetical protein
LPIKETDITKTLKRSVSLLRSAVHLLSFASQVHVFAFGSMSLFTKTADAPTLMQIE